MCGLFLLFLLCLISEQWKNLLMLKSKVNLHHEEEEDVTKVKQINRNVRKAISFTK